MEKLPLIDSFEKTILSGIDQVKIKMIEKKWVILFLYFVVLITILTVFIMGVLKAIDSGIEVYKKWNPPEKSSFLPKRLTYNRLTKNEREENGLYRNLFEIFITSPGGNTNPYGVINKKFIAECEYGSGTGKIEAGIGLATTTERILADCLTEKALVDDGNLFSIIDIKNVKELPSECLPPIQ